MVFRSFVVLMLSVANVVTADPPELQQAAASILAERCLACHGPEKQEGGYRVDSFQRLRKPGDSGLPPIVSDKPMQSELLKRLTTADEDARMPADAPALPSKEVAVFEKWIADGAKGDRDYETRSITSWARRAKRSAAPEHYPSSLPVTALAVTSTSDSIEVWTSGYGEALKWNLSETEAKISARLPVSGQHVSVIDVSFDGKLVVVASGTPGSQGFVEVFARDGDKLELKWSQACPDLPADLAFAPDQNKLAVGQSDGTLLIATRASAQEEQFTTQLLTPHADAILAVSWSEKGDRLITGSRDRTAKIFDTSDWQLIANYDRHERAVGGVAYLDRYPVSLDETGKLRLWSGDDSDRTLAERDNQARFLEHVIDDGKRIWLAIGADLRGWETERKTVEDGKDDEGKPKQKTTTRWKMADELSSKSAAWLLSLDADSKIIAAGNEAGEVIVWRAGEKQPWRRFMAQP